MKRDVCIPAAGCSCQCDGNGEQNHQRHQQSAGGTRGACPAAPVTQREEMLSARPPGSCRQCGSCPGAPIPSAPAVTVEDRPPPGAAVAPYSPLQWAVQVGWPYTLDSSPPADCVSALCSIIIVCTCRCNDVTIHLRSEPPAPDRRECHQYRSDGWRRCRPRRPCPLLIWHSLYSRSRVD